MFTGPPPRVLRSPGPSVGRACDAPSTASSTIAPNRDGAVAPSFGAPEARLRPVPVSTSRNPDQSSAGSCCFRETSSRPLAQPAAGRLLDSFQCTMTGHQAGPLGQQDVSPASLPWSWWSNPPRGPPNGRCGSPGTRRRYGPRDAPSGLFANAACTGGRFRGLRLRGDSQNCLQLRKGPSLRLSWRGYFRRHPRTGDHRFNESWWLGLSGLHTVLRPASTT